jgi:hypothetical protein
MLVDIRNSFFLYQAADLNDILSERGACGVGFVANLKNVPSFNIVRDALNALGCMEHRGGCGADNDSGDGAGLMSGIPWDLFDDWANKQGLAPFDRKNTGVGMVFLPQDEKSMEEAKAGNVMMLYHNMLPTQGTIFFLSPKWIIFYVYLNQRFLLGNPCPVAAYLNCYMEFSCCHTLHAHKMLLLKNWNRWLECSFRGTYFPLIQGLESMQVQQL